ncbi:MAG: hypothetical protein IKQ92_04635 [Clostridia bacterium]|nr:hypothetical protein [Clostridia bacterium]
MKKKEILKKVGILFLNFVLFYALLRAIIAIGEHTGAVWVYKIGTVSYGLLAGGLIIAFFVLNGYTFNKPDYEPEDLPDRWSEEKKREYLEKLPANREKAKKLIYILLPLIVSLSISYIELTFFK